MTIIYDMANGSIQSETALETGGLDETSIAAPLAERQLAAVETVNTPHGHDNPETAIHIVRSLLSSD
jgi:hypothetical protein